MTSTSPVITGPGLKKQGVVVLQIFLIALFTLVELTLRSGTGILTDIVIVVTTFGGIRFGRPGTRYVAAVTPPLVLGAVVTIYYLSQMVLQSRDLVSISWLPLLQSAHGSWLQRSTDGLCFLMKKQRPVSQSHACKATYLLL